MPPEISHFLLTLYEASPILISRTSKQNSFTFVVVEILKASQYPFPTPALSVTGISSVAPRLSFLQAFLATKGQQDIQNAILWAWALFHTGSIQVEFKIEWMGTQLCKKSPLVFCSIMGVKTSWGASGISFQYISLCDLQQKFLQQALRSLVLWWTARGRVQGISVQADFFAKFPRDWEKMTRRNRLLWVLQLTLQMSWVGNMIYGRPATYLVHLAQMIRDDHRTDATPRESSFEWKKYAWNLALLNTPC